MKTYRWNWSGIDDKIDKIKAALMKRILGLLSGSGSFYKIYNNIHLVPNCPGRIVAPNCLRRIVRAELSGNPSDNTTSRNIGGTDTWAVPHIKFPQVPPKSPPMAWTTELSKTIFDWRYTNIGLQTDRRYAIQGFYNLILNKCTPNRSRDQTVVDFWMVDQMIH